MDKYLVSLAIFLLFLEGLWLAHDLNPTWIHLSTSANQAESIGKISDFKSQVRTRGQDSLIWEDADRNQALFAYDSVLTMSQSRAEIELLGDSKISLNENTLVVIEPPPSGKRGEPLRLRFKQGSMRASTGSQSQLVEARDYIVVATPNTKLNLRAVKDSFEIETTKGEVKILDAKTLKVTEAVKSGEIANIGKSVTRLPAATDLRWLQPADNERIYTHANSQTLKIDWEGVVQSIQVNEKSFTPQGEHFENAFAFGDYNIKLLSPQGATQSRSVHIWQAPKIYTISPSQGQRFKKQDEILFLWTQTTGVNRYVLEISSDSDFKTNLKTFESEEAGRNVENLPNGRWFWRVRGKDDSGFTIPELYQNEFYILEKPLEAPTIKQPKIKKGSARNDSILRFLFELFVSTAEAAGKSYFAEFQWDKLQGAQAYVIEISPEPDFRNLLVSNRVTSESYKWKNFKLGRYYWRVAGVDGDGQVGIYSNTAMADLTQIPSEPVTAAYVAPKPKPKIQPAPQPIATPTPQTPPPVEEPAKPSSLAVENWKAWSIDVEAGAHEAYSRFQGGDFTAQNIGFVLGDFRFTLTPPPQTNLEQWKGELEVHLYSLTARPSSQFPFQDLLATAVFGGTFIKQNHMGFRINQYLGFKRSDLENLAFDKFLAVGPTLQMGRSRISVMVGQTYCADYSYLYQIEKPISDTRSWLISIEGRAALGMTLNKNFWYDTGAYLWIGLRWK